MTTELERATNRLYGPNGIGATNVKITPGDGPVSAEALARELNKSLDQLERGEAEEVDLAKLDD